MKKEYILNEIWILTISAAFQRVNIYTEDSIANERIFFKEKLKEYIIELSNLYIESSVEETKHIKNIYTVCEFSKLFKKILINGQLNFGVCQKLLNLYLKYLWCLEILKIAPPHFPVDRIIQTKLKISNPYPWTQMLDDSEYLKVINKAKEVLSEFNINNLSELELYLYSRK